MTLCHKGFYTLLRHLNLFHPVLSLTVSWWIFKDGVCVFFACDVSRCRRSSCRQWWTGSLRSPEPLSWWTKTAAWSPLWSITSAATSRTSRDTTSRQTKGRGSRKDAYSTCCDRLSANDIYRLSSSGTRSLSSMTSSNRPWMLTGALCHLNDLQLIAGHPNRERALTVVLLFQSEACYIWLAACRLHRWLLGVDVSGHSGKYCSIEPFYHFYMVLSG